MATAMARKEPVTTAPMMPSNPSVEVTDGPAPMARSTAVSSAPPRSWRETAHLPPTLSIGQR
jgi:hypothetical protein